MISKYTQKEKENHFKMKKKEKTRKCPVNQLVGWVCFEIKIKQKIYTKMNDVK